MLFSSSSASFAVVLLLTQWAHSTIAAQCYFSDGTEADSSFQPCFPDQENSPCCANNKPKSMANDICLTSGLCLAQMQGYSGLIYQNGCTDQTGKSSQCQTICSGSASGGIHLLPCPAKGVDQWCCSINGTNCCDNAGTVTIGTIYGYTSTSSTSTSTATGTGTGTIATTTVTTTATAGNGTEVCADSSSKTTAVGAGVGAGLGACLVATLFALWFQRRAYQRKLQQSGGYAGYGPTSPDMTYAQSGYSHPSSGAQQVVSELHSPHGVIHEVDGREARK